MAKTLSFFRSVRRGLPNRTVAATARWRQALTGSVLAASIAVSAGGVSAAPIDLAALNLVADPSSFATESVGTNLFGGVAFDSNNLFSPGTINVAVAGSAPFNPTNFGLSAFPVIGVGTLEGTSSAVGWDLDLIEVLIDVTANSGAFSSVAPQVLVSITGSFGTDPIGLGGGPATLSLSVPSLMTLTNVNPIPVPALLPVIAVLVGGAAWAGRKHGTWNTLRTSNSQ